MLSPLFPCSARSQDTAAVVVLPAVRVDVLRSGLRLERAPLSASILGPDRTRSRGPALAVAEVLGGLPGVQADDRYNAALGERLSIRGSGARSTFGIRGVRVLVDGIPATMPDGQTTLNHVDPGALVGVELVRGAAGAFLGNAAGGALQLRTGATGRSRLEGVAGGAGLRRLGGSTSFAQGSAYASWQRQGGFRAYSSAEREIAGAVLALPAGRGRIEAVAHATHYAADNPGSLTAEQLAEDPTQANANNVRQRTAERGTHAQFGLGWEQEVHGVALALRGHAGVRDLFNPIPPRIIELDRGFGGIRAQAGRRGQHLQWAAGGELEVQGDERRNFTNEEGERGVLVLDQRERVRGAAWFLLAGWSRGALDMFAALRRDGYRFAVEDRLVAAGNPDDSGSRALGATSVSAGAGIRLHESLQLFANAGTAFETPTTTELANRPDGAGGFNPELEPERTVEGEVGIRARAAAWSADATAFLAVVCDKLIPFEVEALPGRQFFRNAGRARHQGLELSAATRPWAGGEVRASYTRLDARFRRYLSGSEDLAGRRVPGVAGHRLSVEGDARLVAGLRLLVRVLRNGAVPANDRNDAGAAPYTVLGARLADDEVTTGRLAIGWHIGVENAFDAVYTAAVSVNAAGRRYYEPAPGRSFYLGLSIGQRRTGPARAGRRAAPGAVATAGSISAGTPAGR